MPTILSNVCFRMEDSRNTERDFISSNGVLSMCCFGHDNLLVGMSGKLWRVNSRNRKGYTRRWPWQCPFTRLSVSICWVRNVPMEPDGNPVYYIGSFHLFSKKGRQYDIIHNGHLENLNHLLIRLQRWTRRMLHRARVLALAMALHARLGCESMLAGLGCDILPLIVQEFC